MEEKSVPIIIDPWADSFDKLYEILKSSGVSQLDIADYFYIKNNMNKIKDLVSEDKFEEIKRLVDHIHPRRF